MRLKRQHERGQAIAELCLVSIAMMFLLVGALDLGRLFYSQIVLNNAAKEGALVASRGGTLDITEDCSATNTVMCAALVEAEGGLVEVDSDDVTGTTCPAKPTAATPPVSVTVETQFHAITPFIAAVLGGDDVTLSATAASPCAYTPAVTLTTQPTPTPAPCRVPKFLNVITANKAQKAWDDAGFVKANLTINGSGNKVITSETPTGSDDTDQLCATFKLTVVAP